MSNIAEVRECLNRMAHTLGARTFGVDIEIEESGDRLIFVDAEGEVIMNDGDEIIAATPEEIEKKDIGEFVVRALRAAGIVKYQEIERARTP